MDHPSEDPGNGARPLRLRMCSVASAPEAALPPPTALSGRRDPCVLASLLPCAVTRLALSREWRLCPPGLDIIHRKQGLSSAFIVLCIYPKAVENEQIPGIGFIHGCDCRLYPGGMGATGPLTEDPVHGCDAGEL
ncbi:zinc finger protein 1 homolog isoform 3-T5 [Trichechus inunguis]